jgi:signal transduction histidine kinase
MFEHTDSSSAQVDLATYQGQETVFIILNLAAMMVLLSLHAVFASYWGKPTHTLELAVAIAFALKAAQLIWVKKLTQMPPPGKFLAVTWTSIVLNIVLALLLSQLTDHEDSPYFVLMISPILEAAFRFHLPSVISVVSVADFLTFFWIWYYFRQHPPLDIGEYYEAGIMSLTFGLVAVLVWWLVNDARNKASRLARNLQELQRTREKLLEEEKLAVVGRLSSAIAHEIRNPVSMISSSLATAKQLAGKEREEMFEIASEEAQRLVALTTDFLAYARPRRPQLAPNSVTDTLLYVADACRAHAGQKQLQLQVKAPDGLMAETDSGQLQQALINLIMNAMDAASMNSIVEVRAYVDRGQICIDVENAGEPLPDTTVNRIFEPFFTTKPKGSGLGLGIARNIARAHGGDLMLSANGPERIRFSLTLPEAKPAVMAARN